MNSNLKNYSLSLILLAEAIICFSGCAHSNNKTAKQNPKITIDTTNTIVMFKKWLLNVEQLKLLDSTAVKAGYRIWDVSKVPSVWDNQHWSDDPYFPVMNLKDTVGYLKIVDDSNVVFFSKEKKQKWQHHLQYAYRENIKTVLWQDTLYIAIYSPIATGSMLICVHASTGKNIWTGQVKCPDIAHSKYRNEVFIHKVDNRIVLAGDESRGILQVLDSRTGKNLFCVHDASTTLMNE